MNKQREIKDDEKHYTYNTQVTNTNGECQPMKTGFEKFDIHHRVSDCDAKFATMDENHYSRNALKGVSFLMARATGPLLSPVQKQ